MTEPAKPLTDETRNKRGRPKGSQNKLPKRLKEAILEAAELAGASISKEENGLVGYLKMQAVDEPSAFLTLLGKILPHDLKLDAQVSANLVHKIERTIVYPQSVNTPKQGGTE